MNKISVASKTFLVGEYIATQGLPCLLINSEPRFELHIEKCQRPGTIEGISPESPAGKFIREFNESFAEYNMKFVDPHRGLGGLGASTAQFALAYEVFLLNKGLKLEVNAWKELLPQYIDIAWNTQGTPPSGADLISQCFGDQFFYWHRNQGKMLSFQWPFKEYGFFLVRTGNKEATHIHLANLGEVANEHLEEACDLVLQALVETDFERFVSGVNLYRDQLKASQLICEPTIELLNELATQKEILTYKGCGALGADVLFLSFKVKDKDHVRNFLSQSLKLEIIADESSMSGPMRGLAQ